MRRPKSLTKLQKYGIYLRLILVGLFILLFIKEIYCTLWYIWKTLWLFLKNLQGLQLTFPVVEYLDDIVWGIEISHAISVLFINLCIFLSLTFIAYILIAWHVFPIKDPLQTIPIAWRLFFFTFNLHGPLVLAKDGQIIAAKDDFMKYQPGLAIIDHNSAIAIERLFQEDGNNSGNDIFSFNNRPGGPIIRIAKSGIAFTNRGERILNIPLDIRKQIRIGFGVNAQTRDGVQVTAITFAIFTLGQAPNTIQVTCDSKNRKVYVINHSDGKVTAAKEELPERDAAHILSYFDRKSDDFTSEWWQAQIAANKSPLEPEYNDDRLLRAVKTTAREGKDQDYQYWMDLPIQTVIKAFRNTLQKYTYDYLIQPDEPNKFPVLDDIKPYFQRQMNYQGILSYQIVMHKNGRMLKRGDTWNLKKFSITAPQELPHHTELRKAGIKMFLGSFGTLKPIEETIREQFIENWKAKKDMEITALQAEYDLKIQRVMQQAESRSIVDSAYAIQSILESSEYSREALAVLLLRAIKSATMKPEENGDASKDALRLIYGLEILNKWFTGEEPDDTLKNTIFNMDE